MSTPHYLSSLTSFRTSNTINKFSCHWGKNKMNHLGLHPLLRNIPHHTCSISRQATLFIETFNQHLVKLCSVILGGFLLKFERWKVHGKGRNLSRGSEPKRQGSSLLERQPGSFSVWGLSGAQRVLENVV